MEESNSHRGGMAGRCHENTHEMVRMFTIGGCSLMNMAPRQSRPCGFGPTTCGVAPAGAVGDRADSGADGEAIGDQPTHLYPAGKCHPEHNSENPQSALPGTPMWSWRS